MSTKRKFTFPLSTLLRSGDSLKDALADADYTAAMEARLGTGIAASFATVIAAVRTELALQSGKTGEAGELTEEQQADFADVERLSAGARRSARLAFAGQTVILHSEFQVGINDPQDLASVLDRAGKTHTAAVKYATQLAPKGWIATDATALGAAIAALSGTGLDQDEALADRAQFTADLTRAANTLFDGCLTIQNAARLQYPSTQPGTEAARVRFLLETFPPRDRSQPDGGTQGGTPSTPPPNP